MPKLVIDGKEIEVEAGLNLLQACEVAGVEIPRFCYHERLSIAGNCRMCLVEVKGMPKPMASCAIGVNDLRPGPDGELPEVYTTTEMVKKAREGVMEFLLINHPLDCPICDQGGECDLQDQAMVYGVDTSRFAENKRAVEDKYIGPLVKTIMTRCIHCTRCIRFVAEVGGVEELGATGRGEDMVITTYLEAAMTSEMSGNVIDLCPVGALTSRPYAFSARPWELRKTETIDVMDALGSAIRVDTRGREVLRIMPRVNDEVNEEWISDKSRFIWDALKTQRLDTPFVRKKGKLVPASWDDAFAAIASAVSAAQPSQIAALAGDLAGVEEMFALKRLMHSLGVNSLDCRPPHSALGIGGRAAYLFNTTIAGLEDADAVLLVGTNPRLEAPVLNARIRKLWRAGNVPIGVIGERMDATFDYDYLGAGPETLKQIAQGKTDFAKVLKAAKRPALILGEGAISRADGSGILALAAAVAVEFGLIQTDETAQHDGVHWNGFNLLHNAAARVGGLDVDFLPRARGRDTAGILDGAANGRIKLVYLLGVDEIDLTALDKAFVIYQGSHGDKGAHAADVILPGAAYTEKSAIYVNTEGRVQMTSRAAFPPGDARADWAIIRALSNVLGKALAFDSLGQLRRQIFAEYPHLGDTDQVAAGVAAEVIKLANKHAKTSRASFTGAVKDFYLTNPIARASKTMGQCAALAANARSHGTGTDG